MMIKKDAGLDWKWWMCVILIIVIGSAGLSLLQTYYTNDAKDTCTKCIDTCRPRSEAEAFAICKVCWMAPLNGAYLDYKPPTCKPVPSPFLHRVFNLTGVVR